jgi:hypothetical protein
MKEFRSWQQTIERENEWMQEEVKTIIALKLKLLICEIEILPCILAHFITRQKGEHST